MLNWIASHFSTICFTHDRENGLRSDLGWAVRMGVMMIALGGSSVNGLGQDSDRDSLSLLAKAQAKSLSIAFQQAAAKMLPSVVTVLAKRSDVDETLDELELLESNSARDFNIGSGVILSAEGLCVTNNHVIEGSKGIRVRLSDGRELIGTDLKADPKSDLAVFKIKSNTPLPAATLGNSDALVVGEWVIAIGSPFALDQTVSVGIISSKGRSIPGFVQGPMLQTDASINPGNSGGALLDINGDLVGINTAIASSTGSFQGVGIAIPSSRVKWVTSELVNFGKVRRSRLGIRVDRLPQVIADELNLPIRGGVYVTRIEADSPASRSGLEIGDVIVELADQKTRTPGDFLEVVEQLPADKSFTIKIVRDKKQEAYQIQPIVKD